MSKTKRNIIVTMYEKIDKERLSRLISSVKITDEEKNTLYQYKKKLKEGRVQVNYFYSKIGLGRLYAEHSLSLQNFKKEIRHTLASDTYIDIDMVNAHPVILMQYCKKENIECKILEDYVVNREQWLKDVMKFHDISRDKAKKLVLKLCYLGNYTCDDSEDIRKYKKLVLFSEEMKRVSKYVYKLNKEVSELVKEDDSKTNKYSSVLSLTAQIIENKCLMMMKNFLETNGFIVGVLCFDGLMIEKKNVPVTKKLLNKCSEYIKKQTGYQINIEIKPMDQGFKIPLVNSFVNDDKGAQENLFLLEDPKYFRYADKKLYVFHELTGQYTDDEIALYHYITKHSNFLLKEEFRNNNYSEIKSYGRDTQLMNKIPRFVKIASWDDDWLELTANSSLGYLLFKNGIYNMNTDIFTKGFNPNIVFHDRIPHDFPEYNADDVKYASSISFDLMLDDPLPIIIAFARALAGDIDAKKFYFCPGVSNAGKSKLIEMFIHCFGGFIKSFNAENLAHTGKFDNNDEAAKNRWAYLVRFGRILFSNEIKMNYSLNGNSIKKMASGGDKIIGRNHRESETAFVPHFTLFCMLNDIPSIDPLDDAVYNRLVYFEFNKQFVEKVTNPKTQVLADANLKQKINEPRFVRGFIQLILDGYRYFLKHGQPSFDMVAKEDWTVSDKKDRVILDLLRNNFEVSDSRDDYILVSDMNLFKTKHKAICSTISNKRFNDLIRTTFQIEQERVGSDSSRCWLLKRKINYQSDID